MTQTYCSTHCSTDRERAADLGLIKAWRRLGLLTATVALTACATGNPPRAVETVLPPSFDVSTSGADTAVLDNWWLLYDDAQLNMLINCALTQGFTVREALARLEEAQALRRSALSRFDPQGSLQGNAEYRNSQDLDSSGNDVVIPGLPDGFDFGTGASDSRSASVTLPISWELDFFGRRSTARRGADADLVAAEFDVEAARAAIAADVARSLFQSRGLAVQLSEARETLRIQSGLLKILNVRAERGIAATSEADRVAGDVAQTQAQVTDNEAALRASKRALLTVVGTGTVSLDTIAIDAALGDVPPVPAALPGDLLIRRPDVRIADARIRKAASNVRLAELELFPRFTLNPGIGVSLLRGSIDSTTSFWSIGAGLALPILDRGRLLRQLDAEGARAEQAVLAYERTVQTAFSELDQVLIRLEGDRQRVDTLETGQVRAKRAYDAAYVKYQRGLAGLQELLDAERAWRGNRTALASARSEAFQRSVQVFQALGGGWNATGSQISLRD